MKITRRQLRKLISEISRFSPRAARQSSKERMMRDVSPKQLQNLQDLIGSDDDETHIQGRDLEDTLGGYNSPRSHLGYSSKEDIEEFDTLPSYITYLIHELKNSGYQLTSFSSNHISFNENHKSNYANEYVFTGPGSSKDDFTVELNSDNTAYSLTGGPIPNYDTSEAMGGVGYDIGIEADYPIEDIELIFSMVSEYLDQFDQENHEQAFSDYYGPNY